MKQAGAFQIEMMAALPKVQRVARVLTRGLPGAAERAEDLVQDTVVKALAHQDSYVLGSNMGAWLCFICRNLFLSERRRAWRMVEMAEGQAERVPDLPNAHHCCELQDLLTALEHIPAEQRDALLLVCMSAEGDDYESAAAQSRCAVGTIKSRVSRARDALDAWFRTAA